ncbi:hypothetical protein [Denitrobaculum tricleocarpae]|uniref:Uncharacterized protein n=1 Tax=Denitrobaculum tricleocarpae TaxID=2591009 RepID=A0A545TUH8_9PROT|nr:hypothetical protein [Denitrobaculum tricleocarpae]TQV80821.1 hypothetical protein FKG95_11775 [Denitrobaculum tricleocarpae]
MIMGDGSVAGAHITTHDTEEKVLARLVELMSLVPAPPRKLLLTGNFEIHQFFKDTFTPAEKAKAIGYKGKIICFDASSFKPKDGAFVRIISNGPVNDPTIEFKRNEKVSYSMTVTNPVGHLDSRFGVFTADHAMKKGSSINVAGPKDLNVIEV